MKSLVINSVFGKQIEEHGVNFQKKGVTLLRRPQEFELGFKLITYVRFGNDVREEAECVIDNDSIIARNPNPILETKEYNVFNEWVIDAATVLKNYGVVVDHEDFIGYKKSAKVRAVEISNDEFLRAAALGCTEGEDILIRVSWSETPMRARVGDWLTSEGYSISKTDMESYEACN